MVSKSLAVWHPELRHFALSRFEIVPRRVVPDLRDSISCHFDQRYILHRVLRSHRCDIEVIVQRTALELCPSGRIEHDNGVIGRQPEERFRFEMRRSLAAMAWTRANPGPRMSPASAFVNWALAARATVRRFIAGWHGSHAGLGRFCGCPGTCQS